MRTHGSLTSLCRSRQSVRGGKWLVGEGGHLQSVSDVPFGSVPQLMLSGSGCRLSLTQGRVCFHSSFIKGCDSFGALRPFYRGCMDWIFSPPQFDQHLSAQRLLFFLQACAEDFQSSPPQEDVASICSATCLPAQQWLYTAHGHGHASVSLPVPGQILKGHCPRCSC